MTNIQDILIKGAKGDWLYGQDDQAYFDLVSGFGTVFLGHCHDDVVQALKVQVEQSWSLARFNSPIRNTCYKTIKAILPVPLQLTGIHSTGMESSEFSARYAAVKTGHNTFIGFDCSMHGKSMLTANMTWKNAAIKGNNTINLPYPTHKTEHIILEQLEAQLKQGNIAGCFVEPIRGSFDGGKMSRNFMQALIVLCEQYQCLSIFDETLTGLYRTGPRFVCSTLSSVPSILIFAKSIGNGFPISCVASACDPEILKRCLPGSTFSENPLACAVMLSTIELLESKKATLLVENIEKTLTTYVPAFINKNIKLNGKGALWVLRFEDEHSVTAAIKHLFRERILVSRFGNNIRLLPKLEGSLSGLAKACETIVQSY